MESPALQWLHVKEIVRKILFTLMIMLVFNLDQIYQFQGINRDYLAQMFQGQTGFSTCLIYFPRSIQQFHTIFALLSPVCNRFDYRTAYNSFPYFERLSKEGNGRKKMATT